MVYRCIYMVYRMDISFPSVIADTVVGISLFNSLHFLPSVRGWWLKRIGCFYHELSWKMEFMLSLWFGLISCAFSCMKSFSEYFISVSHWRKRGASLSIHAPTFLVGFVCMCLRLLFFICGGLLGRSCLWGFLLFWRRKFWYVVLMKIIWSKQNHARLLWMLTW